MSGHVCHSGGPLKPGPWGHSLRSVLIVPPIRLNSPDSPAAATDAVIETHPGVHNTGLTRARGCRRTMECAEHHTPDRKTVRFALSRKNPFPHTPRISASPGPDAQDRQGAGGAPPCPDYQRTTPLSSTPCFAASPLEGSFRTASRLRPMRGPSVRTGSSRQPTRQSVAPPSDAP